LSGGKKPASWPKTAGLLPVEKLSWLDHSERDRRIGKNEKRDKISAQKVKGRIKTKKKRGEKGKK